MREKLEDPAMKRWRSSGVWYGRSIQYMSYPSEKVFAEVSAKIDLLRSVEESYTQDILNEIRSNKEAALQQLLYSAMLAVTVVLTLMLCVKIVHSLITTIGGEPEEAARLLNAISRGI